MNIILYNDERISVSFDHLPRPGDHVEYRIDSLIPNTRFEKELIEGVVDRLVFQSSTHVDALGRESEYSEIQVYLRNIVRTPL